MILSVIHHLYHSLVLLLVMISVNKDKLTVSALMLVTVGSMDKDGSPFDRHEQSFCIPFMLKDIMF